MNIDRRSLVRSGAAATAALALSPLLLARTGSSAKLKRVVVVALAGGVRTRETLGTPSNVPNLMRIAKEGTMYSRTRATNLGHFGATLSMFTGVSEARGIRDNTRGTDPTVFEYLRKDLGWDPSDVWVSTSGGAQEANVSYSLHPDYGVKYGANTLDGEGIFNAEFKSILDSYGRPRQMEEGERALLNKMRGAIGTSSAQVQSDLESMARVERFLLDELRRGTQDLKGLGAADAKAFRVARNLLLVFKPKLLTIVLREADVAHGSYLSYVEVLRRNDQMLGELWKELKEDAELADSTALFILPEFGRDADLNSRRGLDHGDGSDDLKYVSLVCWGQGFRKDESVQEEIRTIDICSTVCDLFGADARYARGRRLPRMLV